MLGPEVVAISNAAAIVLLFIKYRDAKSAQSACCQHGTSRAAFLARWLRIEFLGAGVEFKLTA